MDKVYDAKICDLCPLGYDRPAKVDKPPAAGKITAEFHGQVNIIHDIYKQVVIPWDSKNIRQSFENVLQYLRLAAAGSQVYFIAVLVFAHIINMPVLLGLLAVKKR